MSQETHPPQIAPQNLVYAIDFGTSNSLVAAATPEQVYPPIPLDQHNQRGDATVLRSILFTPGPERWFFGSQAISEYRENSCEGRLLRSLKRFLPRPSFTGTVIHGRRYTLEELIAVFLRKLRESANQHFNFDGKRVVFGRPALFAERDEDDQLAEQRLTQAAVLAGFEDIAFCPEPVAAAYDFHRTLSDSREKLALIADFGGGTSDFSLVRLGGKTFNRENVLAVGGVSLAGDAFDSVLMREQISPFFGRDIQYRLPMGKNTLTFPKFLLEKLCIPAEISFLNRSDIKELLLHAQRWALDKEEKRKMDRLFTLVESHLGYRLFECIERTKIELSSSSQAPFIFDDPDIEIDEILYEKDFSHFSRPLVGKILQALDETFHKAALKYEDVEVVCCTGGTARIPLLRQGLEQRFGREKMVEHRYFHSVIEGLALRAQEWSRQNHQ